MRIYLSTLTDSQLAAFVHEGTIKPAVEEELRKTMSKKFEIFNVEQETKSREQESELIDKDQARLRENMKALRGSPEEKALLQRYTRELDAQEDRLAGLRKEISDLKAKRAELQAELDTMVMQSALMRRCKIAFSVRQRINYARKSRCPRSLFQSPVLGHDARCWR